MMKYILKSTLVLLITLCLFSCSKDEGSSSVSIVPLSEQAPIDDAALVDFLTTNYYNEEEFDNAGSFDPGVFKYDIEFSTVANVIGYDSNGDGDINASDVDNTTVFNRTALIDLVETKVVTVSDVDHNLYILKRREGLGLEQPKYCDSTFLEYKGLTLEKETFDGTANPVWLDLSSTVKGFSESVSEFKTASGVPIDNGDGTFTFQDFGVGAVFMPSGLGYYASYTPGIDSYSPLIFTLKVMDAVEGTDHDNDGVPTYVEDLNANHDLNDDDTDGDQLPDFADPNDDNDPILTIDEDIDGDGDPTNDDTDGDGIPNYLDSDS